jgi:acyl-CoA thioester hydrolase
MRHHEVVFDVFFDDLDMFGVLHNARYLLFMERCVGDFWKRLGFGGFTNPDSPDRFHLVRLNKVEYLAPHIGIGELRVRLVVEKIGDSSLVFGFHIMPMDEDRALAIGKRVVVCIDSETRQKRSWSDDFRLRLGPYVNNASA